MHRPYVEVATSGSRGHGSRGHGSRGHMVARTRLTPALLIAGLILAGCGAAPSPTSPASSTPGPTVSPVLPDVSDDGRIVLDRAPAGLACDAIGVDYRAVTFFIDPTAHPQVWVVTDRGGRLSVRWGPSFVGGPVGDPSVLDATGAVVARPGDVLVIPQGAWPSLHGHFVCPSPTALYILDEAEAR